MFVDHRLVEGIDPICLGLSSRGADLLGHLFEALQGSTGEEDPGPLASERAGHRATYGPTRAADHGVPVLEQHFHPPVWPRGRDGSGRGPWAHAVQPRHVGLADGGELLEPHAPGPRERSLRGLGQPSREVAADTAYVGATSVATRRDRSSCARCNRRPAPACRLEPAGTAQRPSPLRRFLVRGQRPQATSALTTSRPTGSNGLVPRTNRLVRVAPTIKHTSPSAASPESRCAKVS